MMDRTTHLLRLMQEHHLSPADVARLVGVSPRTVYNWRSSGAAAAVPRHRLDLLILRLGVPALPEEETPS